MVAMVLTAASVPIVSNVMAGYRLRSSITNITAAINTTRYKAIYSGYPFAVTFSKSAGTYQVLSKVPPATSFSSVGTPIPFQTAEMSIDQDNTLTFSPSGMISSSVGSPITVKLTYKGKTNTITVSAYGQIKVNEQ